tara:strand:- start:889 stop:1401 length:513 start_codon:yes stop_codon:yes gene_type:complete
MPLLCITLKQHETAVKLPSDVSAQDAILRMVAYDQHKKDANVAHYPSWEIDLSDILGSTNECKNSSGNSMAGSNRLSLPNCFYLANPHATASAAVIYPNVQFHLNHLGVDAGKIRVYHEPTATGLDALWSQQDKTDQVTNVANHTPDWYFREIKLYFEYQTNDRGPSSAG